MLEAGISQLVASSSSVQALIGTGLVRFYPLRIPENPTYPCASYHRISETPNYLLSGESDINQVRLQIDTWSGGISGASYADAKAVQAAIRDVLEGYQGLLPDGTRVACILVAGSTDLFEQDARCYRTTTDYMIQFYPS